MPQTTEIEVGKYVSPKDQADPSVRRMPARNDKKSMKTWKKVLLYGGVPLALIILVAVAISWSKRGVVTVQTGKVAKQDISSVVTATGEIKPPDNNYANVNANTMGKITGIYVKEGDQVKKGQVLLRTEAVQAQASVDAQEAAIKTAQADVEGSQASVNSAQAAVRTSQADIQTAQANLARTKLDYQRGQELLNAKLIAENTFDQRLNDYKVAEANLAGAQARASQAKAQLQTATYNHDMASARLAQNKATLIGLKDIESKTVYTSPLDGTITSLPVHEGENVVPGIQNTVGSLLFQVSDLAVITAEVKVDETDIINVRMGQPAEVTIDAVPNKTFKGKVTKIGQSAIGRTSGSNSSQTSSTTTSDEAKDFLVQVTLDSPPPGMRPGLSATAKVTTASKKDATTIPIMALTVRTKRDLETQSKDKKGKVQAAAPGPTDASKDAGKEEIQGVFTIHNGVAQFEKVDTGIMGATDVEITKGLKPGDEIVTGSFSVLRTLKNNTKVKIDNSVMKGPGA